MKSLDRIEDLKRGWVGVQYIQMRRLIRMRLNLEAELDHVVAVKPLGEFRLGHIDGQDSDPYIRRPGILPSPPTVAWTRKSALEMWRSSSGITAS